MNYEINITYRCDTVCRYCNRLVGVLPMNDKDLCVSDVERFADGLRSIGGVSRVKLSGGEPVVHKQFDEIIDALDRLVVRPQLAKFEWILTNKEEAPKTNLPKHFRFKRDPKPLNEHLHWPFLVSPHDLGMEPRDITRCKTQKVCGFGFDRQGWTGCGVMAPLGWLLGIKVHQDSPMLDMQDICKHCIYSRTNAEQHAIKDKLESGKMPHVTETFAEALKRQAKRPHPRTLVSLPQPQP